MMSLHKQLILVLYDGAIKSLEKAKKECWQGDLSGKELYLNRTLSAINELRSSLRFDDDKKLADSLNQLYFFMTKQIAQASLNNDSKPLDVMISLLKGLKSAWEEAMGKEHSKKVNRALA